MSIQTKVKASPISSIDATTLIVTYQAINVTPLANAPFYIKIQNLSDKDVAISFDGVTDNEFIKAGDKFELNVISGALSTNQIPSWPKLLVVYARAAVAPTTGRVYFSSYYMQQA